MIFFLIFLYYKAKSLCICLFVCLFYLSGKRLRNRLTQAHKIGNECRVNFSWSSEHIFNFLRFVIQKLRVFKERTERFSVRNEKSKYTRHYSRYVTEGGAKMLIRRFRNNDTGAFRKYWRGKKFRVINSKAIMISPREICKILLTPRA